MPPFSAHNIVLDDGTQTLPGREISAETGICQTALQAMRENFPGSPGEVRVADLGALEGGYAVALARAGYRVTAIEVRAVNMDRCRYVAAHTHLPNLEFIQDDARSLPLYGEFDAVLCSGLLYHLDRPVSFLKMLGAVTRRLLILQTHYSAHPVTENEGVSGHWYTEDPSEESAWSSYGNSRSFWLSWPCLLDAIESAGFSLPVVHLDANQVPYREWGLFTAVKRARK